MPSNIHLQKCLIFCDPTHPRNCIFLVSLLVPGHPNYFYEFDYLKSSVLLYQSYFIKHNVIKVIQCYNVSEFSLGEIFTCMYFGLSYLSLMLHP